MILKGKYAASNFFNKQGLYLDTEKKCFNKYTKLFSSITFNEGCTPLPKLDYVLMFKTLYAKCESCTLDDFEQNAHIQLSLVYNQTRRLIIHESKNFEEIKEMAKELSRAFKLKIRDSASDRRHPTWIEL